jgi:alpha-L-fucosidase
MIRKRNQLVLFLSLCLMLGTAHGQRTKKEMVSLRHVPHNRETVVQRNKRMQWFRDAKFGMFIHWGPCSVGAKEIGWGREGNRTFDVSLDHTGTHNTPDPVYDNYYKQFNPEKYDPNAWVTFARESGMKYMVLIAKHHDGFSLFDSKVTDYDIMASPYGRDIVREFATACRKQGMKFGLYYSTRDWYHPDYMQGDNTKYDTFYRTQVQELLSNYGNIDIMWFDHVGGQDWSIWRMDKLFAMMYGLQPNLIVNNRAAKFCGRGVGAHPSVGPVTSELRKIGEGDFYTPEGRIGVMDISQDWESCIHVGKGWSYRGEEGFKEPEDCIRMLISCTTGGGNLLLNFGPRPDGTLVEGETRAARAVGEWLKTYGGAIYGTRGGPYRNGSWGGSCHKDKKIFLHIYQWVNGSVSLDPLPYNVISARTLTGAPVKIKRSKEEFVVEVAEKDRDTPVTVVELTLEKPVQSGKIIGGSREELSILSKYGETISAKARLGLSSTSSHDHEADHSLLFTDTGAGRGYAFHTADELNPWVTIDLRDLQTVNAVRIENRAGEKRTDGLILSISEDGKSWEKVWKAEKWKNVWMVPVTRFHAGLDTPGRSARFLKLETKGETPRPLLLHRVTVYGEKE